MRGKKSDEIIQISRLHKFQVKKLDSTDLATAIKRGKRAALLQQPSFFFYFDTFSQLAKVRIE